jgi:hypothetical protein
VLGLFLALNPIILDVKRAEEKFSPWERIGGTPIFYFGLASVHHAVKHHLLLLQLCCGF